MVSPSTYNDTFSKKSPSISLGKLTMLRQTSTSKLSAVNIHIRDHVGIVSCYYYGLLWAVFAAVLTHCWSLLVGCCCVNWLGGILWWLLPEIFLEKFLKS